MIISNIILEIYLQTGHTALQRAAAGGHLDIARLLVTQGASLDHQDELVILMMKMMMMLMMMMMIVFIMMRKNVTQRASLDHQDELVMMMLMVMMTTNMRMSSSRQSL